MKALLGAHTKYNEQNWFKVYCGITNEILNRVWVFAVPLLSNKKKANYAMSMQMYVETHIDFFYKTVNLLFELVYQFSLNMFDKINFVLDWIIVFNVTAST